MYLFIKSHFLDSWVHFQMLIQMLCHLYQYPLKQDKSCFLPFILFEMMFLTYANFRGLSHIWLIPRMMENFLSTDNVERKSEMVLISFPWIVWRNASTRSRISLFEAPLNLCILIVGQITENFSIKWKNWTGDCERPQMLQHFYL